MANIQELIDKLNTYQFECQGGPLENCLDWRELLKVLTPRWTSERPMKAGWYWWRNTFGEIDVVEVEPRVMAKGLRANGHPIEHLNGEWAGPLEVPR